ncbi:hypothetical protein [Plasmodium yoelii yoelii]|uniref:Uncharacterized protein n=1 Tax=Plasmodium yoelii yoelii TaxID=73239 RepID=Q7RBG1_PLAYO|nr:hypothetical protein [Plasmodium yoelii yoelii]
MYTYMQKPQNYISLMHRAVLKTYSNCHGNIFIQNLFFSRCILSTQKAKKKVESHH